MSRLLLPKGDAQRPRLSAQPAPLLTHDPLGRTFHPCQITASITFLPLLEDPCG
jgi:hypothetical protein